MVQAIRTPFNFIELCFAVVLQVHLESGIVADLEVVVDTQTRKEHASEQLSTVWCPFVAHCGGTLDSAHYFHL